MIRKLLLRVVTPDVERCTIDAADHSVAFKGDALDAPQLCCGACEAPLVIGIDRRNLSNMIIECHRCGAFNDTREQGMAQSGSHVRGDSTSRGHAFSGDVPDETTPQLWRRFKKAFRRYSREQSMTRALEALLPSSAEPAHIASLDAQRSVLGRAEIEYRRLRQQYIYRLLRSARTRLST